MSLIDFIQGALMVGVGVIIAYITVVITFVVAVKTKLILKFTKWYLNTLTEQYGIENKETEA